MLNPPENKAGAPPSIPPALRNCLSLDLEIDQDSRLIAVAAYRPDIEVQGAQATFGGTLQEPGVTSSGSGIIVEGAGATFGGNLQEP